MGLVEVLLGGEDLRATTWRITITLTALPVWKYVSPVPHCPVSWSMKLTMRDCYSTHLLLPFFGTRPMYLDQLGRS